MTTNQDDQRDLSHDGTPAPEPTDATQATDATPDPEPADDDMFPRKYVQELRDEAAKYRQRAGRADELSKRLHHALVAATGRLADPDDLTYDETHLEDAEALEAAITALLERKPHLTSRRPRGDIGQGAAGPVDDVSLSALLRANA